MGRRLYPLVLTAIAVSAGLSSLTAFTAGAIADANGAGIETASSSHISAFLPLDSVSERPQTGGTPLFDEPEDFLAGSFPLSSEELSSEEDSSAPGESDSSLTNLPSEPEASFSSLPSSEPAPPLSSASSAPPSSASSAPSSAPPASSASSAPPASSSAPSSSSPSSQESASSQPSSTPESSSPQKDLVRVSLNGSIVTEDLYTILCQVVQAEVGGFHTETLKAQAVASRTYILYELQAGRTPYLAGSTPSQRVKDAVSAVEGQAVYYGGQYAFTPYHASSAGATNSSLEVWGGYYPYLVSVPSIYDPSSVNKNRTATFSESTIRELLENNLGGELAEDPNTWFENMTYNSAGYVSSVSFPMADGSTKTISGRRFRENVMNYAIRSHAFTASYSDGTFTFVTNGYGHGVGLSQAGANGYALNGWTYLEILSHFYPGTSVY